MKIAVIGPGYVGLMSGTCLADLVNDMRCPDVDPEKIKLFKRGDEPFYEPGLDDAIRHNVEPAEHDDLAKKYDHKATDYHE